VRIHKVTNRRYQGTTYYRWVVSIAPRKIRDLGWVNGQELEAVVQGSTLAIRPAIRPRSEAQDRLAESIAGEARARALGGRRR
jgi:hypothetical protein